MEIISNISKNTSLWEIVALLVVIYLICRPNLINRITKFKVGDFELEISELKKEIENGKEKINELQEEIESEKRLFEEVLNKFDANDSLDNLASIRQIVKSESRNSSDINSFKKALSKNASPEELYAVAVGIREKRPLEILPDLISLLDELTEDKNLGGYRLNTIWTLTSSVHKILIACIRDGQKPFPSIELLNNIETTLKKLEKHPKVQADRPDDPSKGIRGPIKHSLSWLQKAREKK
ncbi:hypothetical protein EQG68_02805 [Flavobacterium piscinae]|uniref:Uncharacterized protein n=1 Tax=Flavobacterium piscinae TaxID=2506424 RepID=A0A4V1N592_9FLAO|nr:hypothetical protein [Flavobacterium piscinae]RXR34856.1 hypothetical protein EQG68_02805 [Flavobacterium piscinae]